MPKLAPIKLPTPSSERFFAGIDPFDARYYEPEIAKYLSERSRIAFQAYVEAALAHTLADYEICSAPIAETIEKAAQKITAEEVYAEEQLTKHDVKALVNCLKRHAGPKASPYVHFSATSYDIISTAQSLQLQAATRELVIPRLLALEKTLIDLAEKYATTTQIGRTHGQHGVPITFGFAVSEYISRLGESILAIEALAAELKGKFSGAVGSYNALSLFVDDPLKFEKDLLAKVNLEPAPHSTQIVPAENTVRLIDELAIAAGIMANLAHDMRHLQRSEIAEVRERFEKGQTGSSTMAHKRNPINFENVASIYKQVLAQITPAGPNRFGRQPVLYDCVCGCSGNGQPPGKQHGETGNRRAKYASQFRPFWRCYRRRTALFTASKIRPSAGT
jgi:adenylosuccinate lyase